MQLTQIDRWLRERFIYQTHVYTMRLPESGLSGQVTVEELEESPSRRYRYRLIVNAKRDLESLLTALRSGNQMFVTRIVETDPWYRPIIAPRGKSFFLPHLRVDCDCRVCRNRTGAGLPDSLRRGAEDRDHAVG